MYLTVEISLLWVTLAKPIEVSDLIVGVSLPRVVWWCVPCGPYMHHILCDMTIWCMDYVTVYAMKSYGLCWLLTVYAMKSYGLCWLLIVYPMKSYGLCWRLTVYTMKSYGWCWLFMLWKDSWSASIICHENVGSKFNCLVVLNMQIWRSIIESCHEMLMELECIFMLCNMSRNVSYVICHVM